MSTLHAVRIQEETARECAAGNLAFAQMLRADADNTLTETPVFCAHAEHGLGWAIGHTQGGWTMFRQFANFTAVPVDVAHLTEIAPPELPAPGTPVLCVQDGKTEAGIVVRASVHGGVFVRFADGIVQQVRAHRIARMAVMS